MSLSLPLSLSSHLQRRAAGRQEEEGGSTPTKPQQPGKHNQAENHGGVLVYHQKHRVKKNSIYNNSNKKEIYDHIRAAIIKEIGVGNPPQPGCSLLYSAFLSCTPPAHETSVYFRQVGIDMETK